MTENNEIYITDTEDLEYLMDRFNHGPRFSIKFWFKSEVLKNHFFKATNIELNEKGFYCCDELLIHISENNEGYTWISTDGLVMGDKYSDKKYINAFLYQKVTINLLVEKALVLGHDELTYDVNSYNYGYLSEITPALFSNLLLYIELFGKAYLDINECPYPHTHNITDILLLTKKTMYNLNQNDTLFHVLIYAKFELFANYVRSIPDNFKEHFVKYDDNRGDFTIIKFNIPTLTDIKYVLDLSSEFIMHCHHFKNNDHLLKQGLFKRLLDKLTDDKRKQIVTETYGYLIEPFENE